MAREVSQPQSWLRYGPDLGVWVGQLPWKISLYCMYIDMSWKFCVIIQLYLSVPEELNSTSPPCFFSLVPAFSCDLLCYPEWRKEQNPPYFSLVNALHEGEITEMLWLKKKKKSHESAFLYCFYTCGELEVLKYEVHWEKKNQEENVFWKNKPGREIRFLPFLTIFFEKIKIPSLSSEFLRFSVSVMQRIGYIIFSGPSQTHDSGGLYIPKHIVVGLILEPFLFSSCFS